MENKSNVEKAKLEANKKQAQAIKKIEIAKLERTGYDYKRLLQQKNRVFYIATGILFTLEIIIFFLFIFLPKLSDFKIYAEIILPVLWIFSFLAAFIYTAPSKKILRLSDLEAGKEKQRLDEEEKENIRKRNKNRYQK
ncbi:MAG: hypothetical protein PHW22_02405 [Bacilli bacterium]|nr:hypothetical protein [Bacilli bacterium]